MEELNLDLLALSRARFENQNRMRAEGERGPIRPLTIYQEELRLKKFMQIVGKTKADEIVDGDFEKFKAATPTTKSSNRQVLKSIRRLLERARNMMVPVKTVLASSFQGVPRPKRKVAMTPDIISALRSISGRQGFDHLHWTMFVTLLETGARVYEGCTSVNCGDVDMVQQRIYISAERSKTGRERFCYFGSYLKGLLQTYYKSDQPDRPLFISQRGTRFLRSSVWGYLKDRFVRIGHPELTTHCTRVSYVTWAREVTKGDTDKVYVQSGHTTPGSKGVYVAPPAPVMIRMAEDVEQTLFSLIEEAKR